LKTKQNKKTASRAVLAEEQKQTHHFKKDFEKFRDFLRT